MMYGFPVCVRLRRGSLNSPGKVLQAAQLYSSELALGLKRLLHEPIYSSDPYVRLLFLEDSDQGMADKLSLAQAGPHCRSRTLP